jgi:hypothetical protein
MKKAAFALLILLLLPLKAWSTESVGTALNIVEDFSREANILIESRGLLPLSSEERERIAETLRQIRLTEAPGRERSEKIYLLVSSYTAGVLESVRASKGNREAVEEAASRLEGLKKSMLVRLRAAVEAESVEKKEPRPVPSFDLSPHDEPPAAPGNDKEGILFR